MKSRKGSNVLLSGEFINIKETEKKCGDGDVDVLTLGGGNVRNLYEIKLTSNSKGIL